MSMKANRSVCLVVYVFRLRSLVCSRDSPTVRVYAVQKQSMQMRAGMHFTLACCATCDAGVAPAGCARFEPAASGLTGLVALFDDILRVFGGERSECGTRLCVHKVTNFFTFSVVRHARPIREILRRIHTPTEPPI